jgi:hypothetical protein
MTSDVRATAGRFSKAAPAWERIEQIDARLGAITKELKDARRGPLPRAEVADRLVAWLRSRREAFERPYSSGGQRLSTPAVVARLSAYETYEFSGAAEVFDMVVFLFPDLEERARAAVARADYPEGLPSAERARAGAALEAETERLVTEREGHVETCRAAGVDVSHRPETQARINAEQRAEQLRADQRARQQEAEREIEEREARAREPRAAGHARINGERLG